MVAQRRVASPDTGVRLVHSRRDHCRAVAAGCHQAQPFNGAEDGSTVNAMRATELDRLPVTYEEFLGWPVTATPCDVVDGQPIVSPAPDLRHQIAVARLHVLLQAVAPPPLLVIESPVDWVLRRTPLLVRQPDLAVIDPTAVSGPHLLAPPTLVVEVLSAFSQERDLVTKRREYARAGLDHYWLLDPAEPRLLVLRRAGDDLVPHASASGDAVLRVEQPFVAEVRPSDLG
jgi:Uma2 family endonuclease